MNYKQTNEGRLGGTNMPTILWSDNSSLNRVCLHNLIFNTVGGTSEHAAGLHILSNSGAVLLVSKS